MDINFFRHRDEDIEGDIFDKEEREFKEYMKSVSKDYLTNPYNKNWAAEKFVPKTEKELGSYDFLKRYSDIYNLYSASVNQPNPYSNRAIFIIDMLSKMNIKFRIDIFPYSGSSYTSPSSEHTTEHRLINIIAEPNPQIKGPAILFCAHHDVANVHSQNCADNGASVCNLLRLTSLISQSPETSERTLIIFTDCEESGAKGANHFAKDSKVDKDSKQIIHNVYGEISGIINLELTGKGNVIWSDCHNNPKDILLHSKLEKIAKKSLPKYHTPPSDAIAFRRYDFPTLCIGILPSDDLKDKNTWRLCHSTKDTLDGCNEKDMKDFTEFLLSLTKVKSSVLPEVILLPAEQTKLNLD